MNKEITVNDVLVYLRKYWMLVLVIMLLVISASYFYSIKQRENFYDGELVIEYNEFKLYTDETQQFVNELISPEIFIQLATSEEILSKVSKQLEKQYSVNQLRSNIRTSINEIEDKIYLNIKLELDTQSDVQEGLNILVEETVVALNSNLDAQLDNIMSEYMTILDESEVKVEMNLAAIQEITDAESLPVLAIMNQINSSQQIININDQYLEELRLIDYELLSNYQLTYAELMHFNNQLRQYSIKYSELAMVSKVDHASLMFSWNIEPMVIQQSTNVNLRFNLTIATLIGLLMSGLTVATVSFNKHK